jgi:hypothetical protein
MSTYKIRRVILLTIIFLLTFTTSAFAAQINDIFDISHSESDSTQYQFQLLLKLINNYNPAMTIQQKEFVSKTILSEANNTGFDPFFISSIIAAESSFCPNAVSPCEALGLMQLTNCVSRTMHIRNPFNIQENIYAGTRFLKYLKSRFTDNNLILAAYNAGPTRVARLGRIPRIRETICYIKKVNSIYSTLRQDFFALIKTSLTKNMLCRTINNITNGAGPIQTALQKSSPNPSQINNPINFLCETDRSFRFILRT